MASALESPARRFAFRGPVARSACGLAAWACLVHARAIVNQFVEWGDAETLFANEQVRAGWRSTLWAFTAAPSGNWHPLTWLSHLVDWQLAGEFAPWHHAVSVGWHAANVVLLCLLLHKLTGALGRSVAVAAIWAAHPLTVETVAWAAQRQRLLAATAMLASAWCYIDWARERNARRYVQALIGFGLALLCHPSAVALPALLLVIDYWPLERHVIEPVTLRRRESWAGTFDLWIRLAIEKLPFFAPALLFSLWTWWLYAPQRAALPAAPWWTGPQLALAAPLQYVRQALLPIGLAPLDIYAPGVTSWTAAAASVGVVLVVAVLASTLLRSCQAISAGWWWFLLLLVPTLGLLRFCPEWMADRHAYLPLAGLVVALVWGAADALASIGAPTAVAGIATGVVGVALAALTWLQIAVWHDSGSLYARALAHDATNAVAHAGMARWDLQAGRFDAALEHADEAARLTPRDPQAHVTYAYVLRKLKRLDDAIEQFNFVLDLDPNNAEAFYGRGNVRKAQDNWPEALADYKSVARLQPENRTIHFDIAEAQQRLDDRLAAIAGYRATLKRDPEHAETHWRLAQLLIEQRQHDEAEEHLRAASRLKGNDPPFRAELGLLWQVVGKRAEAIEAYRAALEGDAKPELAANNLAWILSTSPDAAQRDGAEALRLTESIDRDSATPSQLDTIAAALAEAGRFDEAAQLAQRAADLALQQDITGLAARIQKRANLYGERQAYREEAR